MEDLWVNPGKFPGTGQQILGKATHFQAREGQEANENSHLRFITDKSCVTSLMASVMTGSVDEERALGVIYLDFSKAIISSPMHYRAGLALKGNSTDTENGSAETTLNSNGKSYTRD